MKPVVAFGEIMGRIAMPGFRRFNQSLPGTVEFEFAGAEANVLRSLADLGLPTRFITALPSSELGDACIASLRSHGIDTGHIRRTSDGRLGLYFLEKGAAQRAGVVLYDRDGSSIAITPDYPWATLLADAGWLHLTGITPALSQAAADANLAAARTARSLGIPVSVDLNFRSKLWRWEPGTAPRTLANRLLRELLPFATHCIAGREDAAEMLGIRPRTPPPSGDKPDLEAILDVARQLHETFPNLEVIAITLRQTLSASHHLWGGLLHHTGSLQTFHAPATPDGAFDPYSIAHIVDRVGTGDAFSAGLIFALNTPELAAPEIALRFATAASCLAHSVEGDANRCSRAEIESLVNGSGTFRVRR